MLTLLKLFSSFVHALKKNFVQYLKVDLFKDFALHMTALDNENENEKFISSLVSVTEKKEDNKQKVSPESDVCKASKAKCSDYRPCLRCFQANRHCLKLDSDHDCKLKVYVA